MKFIKIIVLYPLALIYNLVTSIRNLLFDLKLLPSLKTDIFSIGVGNITAGGTGKTPVVEYLIQELLLKNKAVISRGYGRKSSGFIEITNQSSVKEVGDEPKMLFENNQSESRFFVSESRVVAYKNIVKKFPDTDLIIFDDVFQHRYVNPNLQILLCDYTRPFYDDFVLPAGLLRENRFGAKRADIILVTKCPNQIWDTEIEQIKNNLKKYCHTNTKIFFSYFENSTYQNIDGNGLNDNQNIVLVSALANNSLFRSQTEKHFKVEKHFEFQDHYSYKLSTLTEILNYNANLPIVCTEKDYIKFKELLGENELKRIFVAKIKLKIMDAEMFNEIIFEEFRKNILV